MIYKLEDITLNIVDGVHGDCESQDDSGYYFISVKDMDGDHIHYSGARQITPESYREAHKRTCLGSGDVLFANTGDTIGKMLLATPESVKLGQTTFQKSIALLKPNLDFVTVDYFYYVIMSNRLSLKKAAVGSGQKNLLLSDMRPFLVDIIDNKAKQEEVVRYVKAIDRKLSLNNAINAELDQAAKLLYDYWFVQFDFPNAEGQPYRASGGKMVYNEQLKRKIPKGWEVDKLESKLNMQRGFEPGSGAYSEVATEMETVPFIRVSDLGLKPALYISKEAVNGNYCVPTDVLVSFDGSVGKMAIAMEGTYSSGIRKITPKDDGYSDALIYFIFQSEEIQKTIAKYAVGSNILHAAGAIEHLMFPYEEAVAKAFIAKVDPVYKSIVANHQQNKELVALRDFLLPLLMNGQVTVAASKAH
jgi:type I restriction enzyme S subunit